MVAPSNATSLQLAAALSRRLDGNWRLLACAAGVPDAMALVERVLLPESIEAGKQGPAGSVNALRDHVEALAATDPKRLAALSASWRPPWHLEGHRYWTAAWEASLRHLAALDTVRREDVDVPELASEVAALWPGERLSPVSWRELKDDLRGEVVSFDTLRRLAAAPLFERSLSEADLDDAPPCLLRLLRGRTELLDESARRHVGELALEWEELDPFEAAVVLAMSAHVAPEAFVAACTEVIEALPAIEDANRLIPLAYVLLGRGWRVP